jgi:hypothetical protein
MSAFPIHVPRSLGGGQQEVNSVRIIAHSELLHYYVNSEIVFGNKYLIILMYKHIVRVYCVMDCFFVMSSVL